MRAAAGAPVRCSVRDGVRARKHMADASKASRQSHLTASPVYESSEGGEESAYDDRISLEHLCATCRAARAHARPASDHSCEPAAASSALCRLHSLHVLLTRRWAQMEAPPQSTHLLLSRLCSKMEAPPHSPGETDTLTLVTGYANPCAYLGTGWGAVKSCLKSLEFFFINGLRHQPLRIPW
jgi:hypothetical protein